MKPRISNLNRQPQTQAPMMTAVRHFAPRHSSPRRLGASMAAALVCLAFHISAAEPQPFRAARSVHWGWAAPDATLFYNEMIVDQSTTGSYFMACGWNTGYFGIQELGNGKKVAIFSVWDPSKGDDPNAVTPEQR